MDLYVNPLSDMFVKYLLGREETKDLLIDFLNAVHEDSGFTLITDVTILNPFNLKEFESDKLSVLDLRATAEDGQTFNIEVQTYPDANFANRSLYYWSRLYFTQLKEGEPYEHLKPVITVNLLDFVLFKEHNVPHSCFMLKDLRETSDTVLTDHLAMHFLEEPKFENTEKPHLKTWLSYFRHEGKGDQDMKILLKENPKLERAHNEYRKFTADDAARELYHQREKAKRDEISRLSAAEKRGMEKGIGKGETKQFRKDQIEFARKMKAEGADFTFIQKVTGLSIEEIEKL